MVAEMSFSQNHKWKIIPWTISPCNVQSDLSTILGNTYYLLVNPTPASYFSKVEKVPFIWLSIRQNIALKGYVEWEIHILKMLDPHEVDE